MALSWTHLQALNVLAKAGPRGVTEAVMLAHGFTADILADLVRVGLATEDPETIKAYSQTIKTIKIVRMRITDAGRDALTAAA
jgi:hypothetical protein